jgi:hypothetical protein
VWKAASANTQMRKNDQRKLALAARLRKETTLPIKSIAALVHLCTSKTANATLHRFLTNGITVHKSNEVGI